MGNHRIVLVATEFSTGGLGSYLATLAQGLSARGWEVHLLATDRSGDLFAGIKAEARHDLSGIPLSMRKVRRSAHLLRRIAPEIVLLNHAALVHYALPFLNAGLRPVAVIHSDDPRYYRTAALYHRRIFGWIAPSRGLADRFAPVLPTERRGRVHLIPHGVDARFRTTSRDRLRPGVRIIFIGFLGRTKGVDLLPEIMRRVWLACPAATLTVVGEGPQHAEVETAFDAGEISGRLRFTGAVTRDEVARLLQESDIFLLPTRLEGFGLAIPEAMLTGCVPVVSHLAGVTDEIIDAGRTGFLVDQDDAAGFADAVIRLALDPALRESVAAAGRAAAESRFTTDRMLDAYEKFFAQADDRGRLRRCSLLGWALETGREMLRDGRDTRWLGRRVREIVRRSS